MATVSPPKSFMLATKIANLLGNPTFVRELEELVAKHEYQQFADARLQSWYQGLLEHPIADALPQGLLTLLDRKSLRYSAYEFVPDIYQTLENYKLVACEYGPVLDDRDRRTSRTITLTAKGQEIAAIFLEKSLQVSSC